MDLENDLKEALLELERHHRDFRKISRIIEEVLSVDYQADDRTSVYSMALRDIRKIVG